MLLDYNIYLLILINSWLNPRELINKYIYKPQCRWFVLSPEEHCPVFVSMAIIWLAAIFNIYIYINKIPGLPVLSNGSVGLRQHQIWSKHHQSFGLALLQFCHQTSCILLLTPRPQGTRLSPWGLGTPHHDMHMKTFTGGRSVVTWTCAF